MDTLPTSLEASPFGLSIQRGKKRSRFSCLDYSGGPLDRSTLLSYWIGPADGNSSVANGARNQNYLALYCYFSGCDWNTEVIQARP